MKDFDTLIDMMLPDGTLHQSVRLEIEEMNDFQKTNWNWSSDPTRCQII